MSKTVAFIFAHPDDEAFSAACLIHDITTRGGRPILLCATRGDAGKTGLLKPMSKQELAVVRERELKEACAIMGLTDITHLGHPDGQLADVPREQLVNQLVDYLNENQADIVITFPEDGISGHRDHIAIHHAVNAAIKSGRCSTVQKLYYCTPAARENRDQVSVQIDVTPNWEMKARALKAHESQHFSVERVFGDMTSLPSLPAMQVESFTLVWEQGMEASFKQEEFIF